MLQLSAIKPIMPQEVIPRWKYKKHSFPNGKSSLWIGWKLHPDDAKFFALPRLVITKFDTELELPLDLAESLNEWRVTKQSYSAFLPKICEELNFFETIYDTDGELIAALFKIKYMIDVDRLSYTMKNFDSFISMVYDTIFTPSIKEKIRRMVDENYTDDIESENFAPTAEIASIVQRKKKSLEFLNVHVKAMLMIAFGIKILSFVTNHFAVMRGANIQKNKDIFYNAYIGTFDVFEFEFNIFNKLYAYISSKVASNFNSNKTIFIQQEIESRPVVAMIYVYNI